MNDKLKAVVKELEQKMPCQCDLDKWQPDPRTGHSWVCPIHKQALKEES